MRIAALLACLAVAVFPVAVAQGSPVAQPKRTNVAVADFEVRGSSEADLGKSLANALEKPLFDTGRFAIYPRSKTGELLKEFQLGQSGLTETARNRLRLAEVDIIVTGTIEVVRIGQQTSLEASADFIESQTGELLAKGTTKGIDRRDFDRMASELVGQLVERFPVRGKLLQPGPAANQWYVDVGTRLGVPASGQGTILSVQQLRDGRTFSTPIGEFRVVLADVDTTLVEVTRVEGGAKVQADDAVVFKLAGQAAPPLPGGALANSTTSGPTTTSAGGPVSITAPARVQAGAAFKVSYRGPSARGDYLALRAPDDKRNLASAGTNTDGSVTLTAPTAAGDFTVVYVSADGKTAATVPVHVDAATASIQAPASVTAGAAIPVTWLGPNNRGDYLALRAVGDSRNLASAGANPDSKAVLVAPGRVGKYEIVYLLSGSKAIATAPVEVVAASASLQCPASVPAGSGVTVTWQGPNNRGDYLALRAPNSDRNIAVLGVNADSKGSLVVPGEPGSYTLNYVLGSGGIVVASLPFTVTAVSATITAPSVVRAGAKFDFSWIGPNNRGDYITLRQEGQTRNLATIGVNPNSAGTMTAPAVAGNYTLNYVLGSGAVVVTSVKVLVTGP